MSDQYGTIIDISTVNVGESLTAAAAATTTVLPLSDVAVFSDLGGKVYVDGTRYDYTAVDRTANTITLSSGLVVDAVVDDRVELFPPAPVKLALVDFGIDEGEAVQVTIPHELATGLADGLRPEADREIALVEERAPGELYLKDIITQGLTLLGPAEDLDLFVSSGVYIQLFSGDAASGINYPVPYAGVLEVLTTQPSNLVVQRYTAYRNVVVANTPSIWVRVFGNGLWSAWHPEQDDTGWITTIGSVAVAQTGWTIDQASLRRINKEVHFRIFVTRDGANITVPLGGNIVDAPLFQFVTAYRPGGTVAQGIFTGSFTMTVAGVIATDGVVTLTAVGDGNNINTNDQIAVGGVYLMN